MNIKYFLIDLSNQNVNLYADYNFQKLWMLETFIVIKKIHKTFKIDMKVK